jgi:hypothetical protein
VKTSDVLILLALGGVGFLAWQGFRARHELGVMKALYKHQGDWNPLNGAPLRADAEPAGTFDYWRA